MRSRTAVHLQVDAPTDVAPVHDRQRAAGAEAELQDGGPEEGEHPADQTVAVRRRPGARPGHEVVHFADTARRQEARDEHVGVRQVRLLGAPVLAVGRDAEETPAVGVEDRGEHARRVERGQQYQSIVPSVPTSATVCRSPINPCSATGR
jgi:hypothetical protein